MSRSKATGALVVAALVLAGCGSGREAATTQVDTRIDGINVAADGLRVRNLHIEAPLGPTYPAGGSARLAFVAYNTSDEPDRLVAVTSPDAAGVTLTPGTLEVPPGGELRLGAAHLAAAAPPAPTAVLTGLTRSLHPGSWVRVVLVFERAGEISASAPVYLHDPPLLDERHTSPAPDTEGEGGH